MKHLLTLLFFMLTVPLSAQFRLASNGVVTVEDTPNDSTYIVTAFFNADRTGNGYRPNLAPSDLVIFSQAGQLYKVASIADATLSFARLTITEFDTLGVNTEGAPTGQIMAAKLTASGQLPQVPYNATLGANELLQGAIATFNANVSLVPVNVEIATSKGLQAGLKTSLKLLGANKPDANNQGKLWRWTNHLYRYLNGEVSNLDIPLIGDSKISDPVSLQRPLWRRLNSIIPYTNLGYTSFSFREASPFPVVRFRNRAASELGVLDTDLVGPDLQSAKYGPGDRCDFFTLGEGTGEYAWDSLVIYYVERPGGGTFSVTDSRANTYVASHSTNATEVGLGKLSVVINNGEDISPRARIQGVADTVQFLGVVMYNTEVEAGFSIQKYGASGRDYADHLSPNRDIAWKIIEELGGDYVHLAHGANHSQSTEYQQFRDSSIAAYDLVRSIFPNAGIGMVASIYDNQDPASYFDEQSNYLDSLAATGVIDAAILSNSLAYYNSSEENVAQGVTPDGTHFEAESGRSYADRVWSLILPNLSYKMTSDEAAESNPSLWLDNGNAYIYRDMPIGVDGIVNGSSDPAISANTTTFTSFGRAVIGDQNAGRDFGILTVQGYPGNGGEDSFDISPIGRKTLHLSQRGPTGDGVLGAGLSFSGTSPSGRGLAAIVSYQDGSDTEFAGLKIYTHNSGSADAGLFDAGGWNRTGQFINSRWGANSFSDNTPLYLVGVGSGAGESVTVSPTAIFGTNDTDADGNEVTNSSPATSANALTTLGQVQGLIASAGTSPAGASINYTFTEVAYQPTLAIQYDSLQPNAFIDLGGDLNLSVANINSGIGEVDVRITSDTQRVTLVGEFIGNDAFDYSAGNTLLLRYEVRSSGNVLWFNRKDPRFVDNDGVINVPEYRLADPDNENNVARFYVANNPQDAGRKAMFFDPFSSGINSMTIGTVDNILASMSFQNVGIIDNVQELRLTGDQEFAIGSNESASMPSIYRSSNNWFIHGGPTQNVQILGGGKWNFAMSHIDMNNRRVEEVGTPTAANHAAPASWIEGRNIIASETYDPPSITGGGTVERVVTVSGVATGDFASVEFAYDSGITLNAKVTGTNQVTVRLTNVTGAAIDPASETFLIKVTKANQF